MPSHSRADLEAEYIQLLKEYSDRVLAQTAIASLLYGENSAYRAATRELRIQLQKKAEELDELSTANVTRSVSRRSAKRAAGGH